MTDEIERLAAIAADVENCNDPDELREMKVKVDSLRSTLENRIKTLETQE